MAFHWPYKPPTLHWSTPLYPFFPSLFPRNPTFPCVIAHGTSKMICPPTSSNPQMSRHPPSANSNYPFPSHVKLQTFLTQIPPRNPALSLSLYHQTPKFSTSHSESNSSASPKVPSQVPFRNSLAGLDAKGHTPPPISGKCPGFYF